MRVLPWSGAVLIGLLAVTRTSSDAGRTSVVELFTSQGCSSCPSAESLLSRLAARPGVIALAFHVDYWDGGGWRDRFEIPQAVPRQASYVRAFGLPSAYTPHLVIDGKVSVVGANERQVSKALASTTAGVPIELHVAGDALTIDVPQADPAKCDVDLAAYRSHASTAVGGGENSGRTLEEFGIVRQFTVLGTWSGAARRFTLPRASLPGDADGVAVLLQRSNQGRIVGAASMALR